MNRNTSTAIFALAALGAIFAWRRREQIQDFLEERGISTAEHPREEIRQRFRSGLARLGSRTEARLSRSERALRRAS